MLNLAAWLDEFLKAERLPTSYRRTMEQVHVPLAERIVARVKQGGPHEGYLTVGLCGTQASGKSTMTAALKALLEARDLAVAVLSIDDLYLTRVERIALSEHVHPLLRTRGVPGTHDVPLGLQTFDALHQPGTIALPSFDKGQDDRRPIEQWPRVTAPVQVVIFEGWCVGAEPEATEALRAPINSLEREEDPSGTWRRYVNDAMDGEYRQLFAQIDFLMLLKAPSFEVVYRWRREQEQKLRQRLAAEGADASRVMDDAQLLRFISHYERLTRHILKEMPERADMVIDMGPEREMNIAKS